MTKPYVPYQQRHGSETPGQKAMRRNSMMIGLVCENMLAGRPGLSGLGQFIEESDKP